MQLLSIEEGSATRTANRSNIDAICSHILPYRTYVWYAVPMPEAPATEQEVARLEVEIAKVCGVINAATGRLVYTAGRPCPTPAGVRRVDQAGVGAPWCGPR
jgi:hypothetical protein